MSDHQIIPVILGLTSLFLSLAIAFVWTRMSKRNNMCNSELAVKQHMVERAETECRKLSEEYNNLRDTYSREVIHYSARIATLESENKHLNSEINCKEADQKELTERFEQLSIDILRKQSSEFNDMSMSGIKAIFDPMAEKIRNFEKQVTDTYEKGLRDQVDLRSEIKKLYELNQLISAEAAALTHALRTDSAAQGTWGEVVLQRVLERSGLREGESFITQVSVTDDDGSRWRPDVVIILPENRHLIVDAKVSLTAWEQYVNANDDASRRNWLAAHTDSIRRHVITLGNKDYASLPQYNSPDFVVLFMPVEAAFGAALQSDNTLFGLAWDKRVVLTGPATLLATLRTVASVWRIEQQNKNVREIARQGGLLYDRLTAFTEEMNRIGSQIDRLKGTWQKASDRLSRGKGNLVARAARLHQLGANTHPAESPDQNDIEQFTNDNEDEI